MSLNLSILFFGDIVGRPGREALKAVLSDKEKYLNRTDDFIIANVENASHGFGLTLKNHDELASYGINAMTSGNHIWDKKDIFQFIDNSPYLIRPYNYHKSAHGNGYRLFNNKILLINLLGKTFMQPINCPFQAIEELKNQIGFEDKIVIVDYHAEATAEKISFAKFASSLGVNAAIPERFDVANSKVTQINGVRIIFDEKTNLPLEIERINFVLDLNSEDE